MRAVGDLQICHITRQVWQKLFTAATARAAAEHTLELRLQEYALLLEGHHPELAAELALELQSFALDHGLSSPDLPEPALGSPKRTAARDSGQHAGSVRVVSRKELKARRASVGELSPAFSAASAARRKSVSVKLRCVLVALFCLLPFAQLWLLVVRSAAAAATSSAHHWSASSGAEQDMLT